MHFVIRVCHVRRTIIARLCRRVYLTCLWCDLMKLSVRAIIFVIYLFRKIRNTDCLCNAGYVDVNEPPLNPPESARSYSGVLYDGAPGSWFARSMLNSANSWMPARENDDQWMKVDMGSIMEVSGVAIQNQNVFGVTRINVEHSIDNVIFTSTGTGLDVVWRYNTVITNVFFQNVVEAKWVIIRPKA